MSISSVNVSFEDFWPGFNSEDFFIPLVESALNCRVVLSSSRKADIVFSSVFSTRAIAIRVAYRLWGQIGVKWIPLMFRKSRQQKRVWFTGENQRPPIEDYDLTISFDIDSYGDTNIYLPLVLLGLDWFEDGRMQKGLEGNRAGKVITPVVAATGRFSEVANRPGFVCAFIGNQEPTRMRAVRALERVGNVDVFGTAVGKPVPSKFEIAQQYKFMLCFENDLYPGYVTEKPLEAWISGCIPLWWGIDIANVLNYKAFVNAASYESLEEFVDEVALLNEDRERIMTMGSEPILSPGITLEGVAGALRRLLK
jgi:Glycosyltransferase family 10 (fucosyltransferase) C-term